MRWISFCSSVGLHFAGYRTRRRPAGRRTPCAGHDVSDCVGGIGPCNFGSHKRIVSETRTPVAETMEAVPEIGRLLRPVGSIPIGHVAIARTG